MTPIEERREVLNQRLKELEVDISAREKAFAAAMRPLHAERTSVEAELERLWRKEVRRQREAKEHHDSRNYEGLS